MELKDFVKSVLSNIVSGIREAQEIEDVGAFIAPGKIGGHDYAPHPRVSMKALLSTTIVDFDIAVTVEESTTVGGEGGLKIASIGATVKGATTSRDSHVSRIQFGVPVLLPESQKNWFNELKGEE